MLDSKKIDIGKLVKLSRKKNEMTQADLAEKLGLSLKYIQFIESNRRNPSIKVLYKIAEIFKTDVCQLFCMKQSTKRLLWR